LAGEQLLAKEAWLRTEIDRAVAEVWAELDAEDATLNARHADPNVAPDDGNAWRDSGNVQNSRDFRGRTELFARP